MTGFQKGISFSRWSFSVSMEKRFCRNGNLEINISHKLSSNRCLRNVKVGLYNNTPPPSPKKILRISHGSCSCWFCCWRRRYYCCCCRCCCGRRPISISKSSSSASQGPPGTTKNLWDLQMQIPSHGYLGQPTTAKMGGIGYLYDPGGGDPPFQPMAGCNQARLAKSEGERLMAQASVGWLRKINK